MLDTLKSLGKKLDSISCNLDRIADCMEKAVAQIPETSKEDTPEKEASKGKTKKDPE